jgi:phosphoserine phosphatase
LRVLTFTRADLTAAGDELLARVGEREGEPDLVVAIERGGKHVADSLSPHRRPPRLLALGLGRAMTPIERHPLLKRVVAGLPGRVLDRLRVAESFLRKRRFRRHPPDPRRLAEKAAWCRRQLAGNREAIARSRFILLLDDAIDTGGTMLAALTALRRVAGPGPQIRSAVIVQTMRNPLIVPDYCLHRGLLIRFPWALDAPLTALEPTMPSMNPANDWAFLVDLDGTLCRTNSFRCWVAFMLRLPLRRIPFRVRFVARLKVFWLLLLRKAGRMSHAAFKFALQQHWASLKRATGRGQDLDREFCNAISSRLNPHLLATIKACRRKGTVVVLTTAAPADYAADIAGKIEALDLVVATPVAGDGTWYHNTGAVKRDTTLVALKRAGMAGRKRLLVTDSLEDRPLMAASQAVLLYPPAAGAIDALQRRHPTTQFLKAKRAFWE